MSALSTEEALALAQSGWRIEMRKARKAEERVAELERENERLRSALEPFAQHQSSYSQFTLTVKHEWVKAARLALATTPRQTPAGDSGDK